jgi:excisionase family DNA binding protein
MSNIRYADYSETAKRYCIAKGTLQNWVSARRVPFIKLGGRILFDLDAMDSFVAQHAIEPLKAADSSIPKPMA